MTDDEMNDFCQNLPMTYGEQGADTDGTAMESVFWLGSDGLTCNGKPVAAQMVEWSERSDPTIWSDTTDATRIARKEAANEALFAKLEATMADMRSLRALADERQAECKRLSDLLTKAEEEKSREAVVTDSEKAADQMRQDILGGKIDRAGRQVVRDACDKMDAPKTGRDASNDALGNISRRGGW